MKSPDHRLSVEIASRDEMRLLQLVQVVLLPLPDPPAIGNLEEWRQSVRTLYRQVQDEPSNPEATKKLIGELCIGGFYADAVQLYKKTYHSAEDSSAFISDLIATQAGSPEHLLELAAAFRDSGYYETCIDLVDKFMRHPESAPFKAKLAEVERQARSYLRKRELVEAGSTPREQIAAGESSQPLIRGFIQMVGPLLMVVLAWFLWSGYVDRCGQQGLSEFTAAQSAGDDSDRKRHLEAALSNLQYYTSHRSDASARLALGQTEAALGLTADARKDLEKAEQQGTEEIAERARKELAKLGGT